MKPINLYELKPAFATHPGSILADELDARGIKQLEFSLLIGMQKSQLNEIIKGKRSINAELAVLLEAALEISAEFWLKAQNNHDLALVKIQSKVQETTIAIATWNMMKNFVAVKFLKLQKIIIGEPTKDIEAIKAIYNVKSLDELVLAINTPQFARFRKSTTLQEDKTNLIGWVKYLEFQANKIEIKKFNENCKDDLIKQLKLALFENKNLLQNIKNILQSAGIKVVYQEKADKVAVDGYSFWSNENPTIGITLRHKRIDNFAFTLFHELGHIFLHLKNDKSLSFIDLVKEEKSQKNQKEEIEADNFAKNNLVAATEWNQFFKKSNNLQDKVIIDFAESLKIHPAIIRGRLCFELDNYGLSKTSISYEIH